MSLSNHGWRACRTKRHFSIYVQESRFARFNGHLKADGTFSLDLDITITVAGLSVEDAKKLIEKAHEACPCSNATRGNVDVRLHVNVMQAFD